MHTLVECFTFFFVAYGYSLAVWGLLKSRRVSTYLQVAAGMAVFFAPLAIGSQHIVLRAFALLIAADLMFKMIDYSRHQRHDETASRSLGKYAAFLVPFPVFSLCFCRRKRRPGGPVLQRNTPFAMVGGAVVLLSGFILICAVARIPAVRASFLLDHVLMLGIIVLSTEALSRTLLGIEQLAGYESTPLIQGAFLSRTVGEFWSRFNTRVHCWFYENLFLPSGGRRAPIRGVLLTFFASAVFHEAAFAIATSRLDGYQFTFFMLQAPAVLISRPLHRFAVAHGIGGTNLARAFTGVWMGASSIFFLHGVHRVFPFFYAARPWLP
jgi:hypothetical protein